MFKLGSFQDYLLTFIAIFVAVDALGNIPLFISLVEGMTRKQRRKTVADSVATATIVAMIFVLVGEWVFTFIGITIPDFQIAGGLLLFILSMRLLFPSAAKSIFTDGRDREIGVFPLGTPLITGPAVLTTTLMMVHGYGFTPTFVSLVLNMAIVWLCLAQADFFMRIIGPGGLRALAKIMYILLASIGIMMIRKGGFAVIQTYLPVAKP
jgi:multiple antibiotic resistance protein